MPAFVMATLLDGATSTVSGPWVKTSNIDGDRRALQASVTATGPVSAVVKFYGRMDQSMVGALLGTATLNGTGAVSEAEPINVLYRETRAEVMAITGVGAKVTATVGGQGSLESSGLSDLSV